MLESLFAGHSVSGSRARIAAHAGLASMALVGGCIFKPPPPLPEELAEQSGQSEQTPGQGDPQAADGPPRAFNKGDEPELGMSEAEMRAYATAQGDPVQGEFTLGEAVDGLEGEGALWAVFETTQGVIECELYPDQAPTTVANFVGLARGLRPALDPESGNWTTRAYFDGTIFHRVIEGFMIQGGDPTGTGLGNAGYVIPDEFDVELRHDRAGVLSMANRGAGTGSSQFFITLGPTPHLNDKHTVFGQCTDEGIAVAEAIAATRGPGDRPTEPQEIRTLTIERRASAQ